MIKRKSKRRRNLSKNEVILEEILVEPTGLPSELLYLIAKYATPIVHCQKCLASLSNAQLIWISQDTLCYLYFPRIGPHYMVFFELATGSMVSRRRGTPASNPNAVDLWGRRYQEFRLQSNIYLLHLPLATCFHDEGVLSINLGLERNELFVALETERYLILYNPNTRQFQIWQVEIV